MNLIDGKYFEQSYEVMVAVISPHDVTNWISPYFTLYELPQIINETSDFENVVMKAWIFSDKQLGNAIFLNNSKYRLRCETNCNRSPIFYYLRENSDHISLPDTNHNIKNCRYQVVDG